MILLVLNLGEFGEPDVTTVKQPRVEAVQGSAMVKLVALHSLQVRGRVAMLWPVPWIAHDSFYL